MKKYLAVFAVNFVDQNGMPAHGDLNAPVTFSGMPRIEHIRQVEKTIQERTGYPVGSVTLVNLIELAV